MTLAIVLAVFASGTLCGFFAAHALPISFDLWLVQTIDDSKLPAFLRKQGGV